MLQSSNSYILTFKSALENVLHLKEYEIIIDYEKRPSREHAGRFNLPECNEVAVIMSGEKHDKRDITIQKHDNTLMKINELHRSYDALQYPLLFVYGEDGYHLEIPLEKSESNKKVTCMQFYGYTLMTRQKSMNHLLLCRQLFHQFAVDMFAKIEAERLCFIRAH